MALACLVDLTEAVLADLDLADALLLDLDLLAVLAFALEAVFALSWESSVCVPSAGAASAASKAEEELPAARATAKKIIKIRRLIVFSTIR